MTDDNRSPRRTASRRRVLKTSGAIGVGAIGAATSQTAAASGSATSIGYTKIEGADYGYKDEARDFADELWSSYIEDGSGDYGATFVKNYNLIYESELDETGTLEERRRAADRVLRENYTSFYEGHDAHIVVDEFGESSGGPYAIGPHQTAGQSSEKTGIVDSWFEENDELHPKHDIVGTAGIAARPLMQMYGGQSPDHVERITPNRTYNRYSVMWNEEGAACQSTGGRGYVEQRCSPCTTSTVRDYIDNSL